MNESVLQKLEWPTLLGLLASHTQTEEGRDLCLGKRPNLGQEQIEDRWGLVVPLKRLASQGYRAPVGELPHMSVILKAASLGQILAGEHLRDVGILLESTKNNYNFAQDFSDKCSTLKKIKGRLYPMPDLLAAISKAVNKSGKLNDDASDELMRVRRQKISVRKKIEEKLTQILHKSEMEPYIQDDFFTVRSERYVVPIRIDGRGRVKGSILDTSDSGQTLYVEPTEVTAINDQLQELDLAEKLEIIRIFRELSGQVEANVDTLQNNYNELIELDVLSAESRLAVDLSAGTVKVAPGLQLNLLDARHPLIKRPDGNPAVGNSVSLDQKQCVLIISGPNAGGKTVVLKTVGLVHLMVRAGLLIPADEKSEVGLFDNIYLEMGDSQNLAANLSTFSGHLMGLKPIIAEASSKDLILLDELAVGTDPQTGAAIAQATLEDLADRQCSTLVTTHFDALKGLAINDKRFRNGSMEYSIESLKPTYKLILDVPGQSYGVEVAEQMGLPKRVIDRAKELRGTTISTLDAAVSQLMGARDEARKETQRLNREVMAAEAERARWEQECKLVSDQRQKVAERLSAKYDGEVTQLRGELDELIKKLRKAYKDAPGRDEVIADRHQAEAKLHDLEETVNQIQAGYEIGDRLPGEPARFSDLNAGKNVYVIPLKKDGEIVRLGESASEPIEVEVGVVKLRVNLHDLRTVKLKDKPKGAAPTKPKKRKSKGAILDREITLCLQTPTNSVDLRGMDADTAVNSAWNFIDRAMLRGEDAVILIHGHGTDALKTAVRDALANQCPYDISYRPGEDQEGGNGVTVVALRQY
jgi:DNA mismatch repair protein MutS2